MSRWLACERGAASVEYVIVLVLVALGACLGIAALAPKLLATFVYQQALLLAPFP